MLEALLGGHCGRSSSAARQDRSDRADALVHARARGVDDEMVAIPRAIVAPGDLVPGWQTVSCDVTRSRLRAAAVLARIGAHDLDLEAADMGAIGDRAPRGARERPRIHGVGDDGAAETQVVLGDRVGDAIPRVVDGVSTIAQRLFD
jgi:hypothetical protein